jgi:hypothetical protein
MLTDRQMAQRNCGSTYGRIELCRSRSFRGRHSNDMTGVVGCAPVGRQHAPVLRGDVLERAAVDGACNDVALYCENLKTVLESVDTNFIHFAVCLTTGP